jgi:hypothetical protein
VVTVGQLTAPYENYLVPVLGDEPGVCSVCATSVLGDFARCYQCHRTQATLPASADIVVPIALAIKGGQLAHELSAYKNSTSLTARRRLRLGLAAVLWRWLSLHERCLSNQLGIGPFPLVTHVPSTSGRYEDPVQPIIEHMVGATRDRYEALLTANPEVPYGREARADRYHARVRMRGEPVLLIDDTWTTGGHAQSAAAALKTAGAGPVSVVVIGRHFSMRQPDPRYQESAEQYVKRAQARGWQWNRCRLCD